MRLFVILMTIALMLAMALPAFGMEFNVKIDNAYRFYNQDLGKWLYRANSNVVMELQMANNSGNLVNGISMPYEIYGTEAVASQGIDWIDGGGTVVPSIVRVNGFQIGGFFGAYNELIGYSWDGSLPDSMTFVGLGLTSAWPADSTTMKTRLEFHLSVPMTGSDTGSVCIDSIGWYEQNHEWLFYSTANFGGPYCFEFGIDETVPPEILDVPASLTTPHDTPFDLNLTVFDQDDQAITGVFAVDGQGSPLGTVEFIPNKGNMGTLHWTYDPPCGWVGQTHQVTLYAEDENWKYPNVPTYTIDLSVTNEPPQIVGDCDQVIYTAVGSTTTLVFAALDPNGSGDTKDWNATFTPTPAGAWSFTEGVFQFTPYADDIGTSFDLQLSVADCTGASDACGVTINVANQGLCGDFNFDGKVDILDIMIMIRYKFLGGPPPQCP